MLSEADQLLLQWVVGVLRTSHRPCISRGDIMDIILTFEMSVTVRTDEQAKMILEAVDSGLAEVALKDRILYGGVGVPRVPASPTVPQTQPELKPVPTRVMQRTTPSESTSVTDKPRERTTGIMGRKRIVRKG